MEAVGDNCMIRRERIAWGGCVAGKPTISCERLSSCSGTHKNAGPKRSWACMTSICAHCQMTNPQTQCEVSRKKTLSGHAKRYRGRASLPAEVPRMNRRSRAWLLPRLAFRQICGIQKEYMMKRDMGTRAGRNAKLKTNSNTRRPPKTATSGMSSNPHEVTARRTYIASRDFQ